MAASSSQRGHLGPSSRRLVLARRLRTAHGVRKSGMLLLEGPRFISDLAGSERSGLLQYVLLSTEAGENAKRVAAGSEGCFDVFRVEPEIFAGISSTMNSQGIAAVCRVPDPDPERELGHARLVLALDGIADPGNVGTCIRSAAAFGVDLVLVGIGSACPFTPKAIRSSAGAALSISVMERVELPRLLGDGSIVSRFLLVGASTRGTDLDGFRSSFPLLLVVGSEARGLSTGIESLLRERISIPMRPGIESLNAAVAASIILQSLSRKA